MIESEKSLLPSANTEASISQKVAGSHTPPPVIPKNRKRLSASARKAKREAVATDYKAGHPQLAIMLRNTLSKPQFTEMLAELLLDGMAPVAPSYEVLPSSKAIKSIRGLVTSEDEYVRVTKTDKGFLLTPYTPEGVSDE